MKLVIFNKVKMDFFPFSNPIVSTTTEGEVCTHVTAIISY